MLDKKVAQKLAHLRELMNNPSRKEGSELRIFHELFLMTHEGRDLSPDTLAWLNKTASLLFSPDLLDVLSKLYLDVYGFTFAALRFIDIEDVIDELSNGKILKDIHYLPPGAFNKLKRELLPGPQQYSPERISWVRDDALISQQSSAKHHITQSAGFTTNTGTETNGNESTIGEKSIENDDFSASQQKEESAKNGGDEEPESNDPLFEPTIIPLPDIVEVTTEEEDEEVIFCQRASLYQFESSSKEWKEKGVGDIKILHQREKNTYRILLRRDKIHKLACNHWITTDMILKPISSSTSSWTCFAMDFPKNELLSEYFAVLFKLEDNGRLFYNKFVECQSALKSAQVPKTSTATTAIVPEVILSAPASNEVELEEQEGLEDNESEEEGVEDNESEEEEEYEDVEETVMFEKLCTLSCLEITSNEETWVLLGTDNIKIIYDDEMLCCRITVQDGDQQYLCDNVITIETELKVGNKECVWSGIDYSSAECFHRTFRAQFSSTDAVLELKYVFAEGKKFAEKSDVHDVPDLDAANYDHSNDDHI